MTSSFLQILEQLLNTNTQPKAPDSSSSPHITRPNSLSPTNEPFTGKPPIYPWLTSRLQLPPPVILEKLGVSSSTKPSPSPFPRYGHSLSATATPGGEFLLFGGLVMDYLCNDLYAFNSQYLSATLIQTSGEVPTPRVGHASALASRYLIIWGGDTRTDRGLYEPDLELDAGLYTLNLATREWTRTIDDSYAPRGRYGHSVAIVGSCVYVFGGQVEDEFLNDLWAFDLNRLENNPTWKQIKVPKIKEPARRTGHSCIVYGHRLIIFGGTDSQRHYNDTWEFDTITRRWAKLECTGFIPSPREGHAAALVDDIIYILGGRGVDGTDLADIVAFRISNQRWYMFSSMGPAPSKRSGHCMVADGQRIYVLGGELHTKDPTMIPILDTKHIKYPDVNEPLPRDPRQSINSPQSLTPASQIFSSTTTTKSNDELSDKLAQISIAAGSSSNPLRDILAKLTHLDLTGSHDFAKQLAKEMNVWSKLAHPNILHLWGYVLEGAYPCLASKWMKNGTILRYLMTKSKIDVVQLILGIASGIEYLHGLDIIHSDIKADNVLISSAGRPLICDFGISRRISTTHTVLGGTTTGAIKGSIRWMSPEILDLNNAELIPGHTKEADIWAFGMLVYEVLTQKLPFYHLKLDVHAMLAIMNGQLPLSDDFHLLSPRLRVIWTLCCDKLTCWNRDPGQRPTMQVTLSDLKRCSSITQGPMDSEHCV